MIWRPEDSQPLPLPGPSRNFAAFATPHLLQMDPLIFRIFPYLEMAFDLFIFFWGSSDIFLICRSVETPFTAAGSGGIAQQSLQLRVGCREHS